MRRLTPQVLFARLDEMIEWAKREKEALSRHSTTPVDFLPAASFWCEGRPHAVVYCDEPEHGDDLTRLLSAAIRHFHPECVCVVMEGENRDRGTCALGFASDGLTVVKSQAFYSTVDNVPVFGATERRALGRVHRAVRQSFDRRSRRQRDLGAGVAAPPRGGGLHRNRLRPLPGPLSRG